MEQEVLHLSLKGFQEGSRGAHQHLVYMHPVDSNMCLPGFQFPLGAVCQDLISPGFTRIDSLLQSEKIS